MTPPRLPKNVQALVPNIYWIDGNGSNLYLCVEETGLTLIDAGVPNRAELVFDLIHCLNFKKSDLKQILVTHADYDHVGSLADIQRQTNCAVYASRESNEYLKIGASPKHLPKIMQWIVDRFFPYDLVNQEAINLFKDGDILPFLGGLHVIYTPGHTPDHYAFFSPSLGVMFSGDVLNTRKGPLHTSSDRISADPKMVIRSARKILNYSPAVIACGHGIPLSDHSSDQIMKFYNQLRQKEAAL